MVLELRIVVRDAAASSSSLFVDVDRLEADCVGVVAVDGLDLAAVEEVLCKGLAELERVLHRLEDAFQPKNIDTLVHVQENLKIYIHFICFIRACL